MFVLHPKYGALRKKIISTEKVYRIHDAETSWLIYSICFIVSFNKGFTFLVDFVKEGLDVLPIFN